MNTLSSRQLARLVILSSSEYANGALDTSSVKIYLSDNPISQSSKDKIESAMANKSCSVNF